MLGSIVSAVSIDAPKSQETETAIEYQNETAETIDPSTQMDTDKVPQNDITKPDPPSTQVLYDLDKKDTPQNDTTKPIAPEVVQQINSLLDRAETCMRSKRLTTPANDCALKYYDEILKLDGYNTQARKGVQSIGNQYALWATQALNEYKIRKAKRLVNKGLSVTPENKQLLALQKELRQHKPEVIIKRVDRNIKRALKNIFQ